MVLSDSSQSQTAFDVIFHGKEKRISSSDCAIHSLAGRTNGNVKINTTRSSGPLRCMEYSGIVTVVVRRAQTVIRRTLANPAPILLVYNDWTIGGNCIRELA